MLCICYQAGSRQRLLELDKALSFYLNFYRFSHLFFVFLHIIFFEVQPKYMKGYIEILKETSQALGLLFDLIYKSFPLGYLYD
jgi:hypothetical protein